MKRVTVWEFFCSGAAEITPELRTIQREGLTMLLAIVSDLVRLPVAVTVVWDAKLGEFPLAGVSAVLTRPEMFETSAAAALKSAQQAIVIGPESDGILKHHYELVTAAGVEWCGVGPHTIDVCADKLRSYECLSHSGVPTVPTVLFDGSVQTFPAVIKPRFGAGCEHTFVVENQQQVDALSLDRADFVCQPLIDGKSRSVAAIGHDGQWAVLPPVDQGIKGRSRLEYIGGSLAISSTADETAVSLIETSLRSVGAANGWVGIDFIQPADGRPLVVDINPRLTTSYTGYRRATGRNLAELLLSASAQPIQWERGTYEFGKEVTLD